MSQCISGKWGYATQNDANRAIRAIRQRTKKPTRSARRNAGGHAYRCDHCSAWHIASGA